MKPLEDIRVLSVTVFWQARFQYDASTFRCRGHQGRNARSPRPNPQRRPVCGARGVHPERAPMKTFRYVFSSVRRGQERNIKPQRSRRAANVPGTARQSDVVIENLSPGSMKRLDLGYEEVAEVNPGIIYCSIMATARPALIRTPAHDHQIQAMSGIMDMNGSTDGPPTRIGVFVETVTLFTPPIQPRCTPPQGENRRGQFGRINDRHIGDTDVHGTDEYVLREGLPVRAGNDSRGSATGLYRLRDGDVIITIGTTTRLEALFKVIGGEGLMEEPWFSTPTDRESNIDDLRLEIQKLYAI